MTPAAAARDDVFLHVLEIGDKAQPPSPIERLRGHGLAGAMVAGEAAVLMVTGAGPPTEAEITIPDVATRFVLLAGLAPRGRYDLQLTSGFAPGSLVLDLWW